MFFIPSLCVCLFESCVNVFFFFTEFLTTYPQSPPIQDGRYSQLTGKHKTATNFISFTDIELTFSVLVSESLLNLISKSCATLLLKNWAVKCWRQPC